MTIAAARTPTATGRAFLRHRAARRHSCPTHGHAGRRRDAPARRGARPRRDPDAQPRDVRDDVDGARGAAGHRREPAPQLHRPRRVPADGRDRAALHPHARRPLPRARRDDRHAHAGLVGGDHARRAVAEVEVARAPRGGRAGRPTGRTSSSAATCTSCGRSSAATSTSSRGSSRCSPTSSRSGPRTSSRTSTRTRSASPPCSARRSPATPTTSRASTTCCVRLKDERGLDVPLHVDGASGGFVWPFLYPDTPWDFRLEQVRSINVSGHKYGLVYPGLGWLVFREPQRPARGPRLLRELPRQARRDVHAELLDRRRDGAGAVLQLRPLRARGLPLHHGDDAAQRARCCASASRRSATSSWSAPHGRRAAAAGRLQARRRARLRRVRRRLAARRRARLDGARLHAAAERRARHDHARARASRRSASRWSTTLADDIAQACATLDEKGGLHELDRRRVKTGIGY